MWCYVVLCGVMCIVLHAIALHGVTLWGMVGYGMVQYILSQPHTRALRGSKGFPPFSEIPLTLYELGHTILSGKQYPVNVF